MLKSEYELKPKPVSRFDIEEETVSCTRKNILVDYSKGTPMIYKMILI